MRALSFSSSVAAAVLRTACRLILAAVLPMSAVSCGGGDAGEVGAATPVPPTVTTIVVGAAGADLTVGQTRTVTAEARDQRGAVMSGIAFTWASSNGTVASVAQGVATGLSAGTASITASSGGVTSPPVTLTVVALAQASRVVVDKPSVFLTGAGQTARLSAQVVDPQGVALPVGVVWTSTAPGKVSVDANGQLVALAIGSAQVFAQVGAVRSPPTLVFVAEPQPGATLVTDAQVVSVGPFLGLAAGASPGVGAQYEVTLTGVAAPLPGSVVLAAETAPIVGTVVATRQEAAGLVVTLAFAPLYQVFRAYDIGLAIDLSAFAFEAVASRSAQAAPAARSTSLAARWNAERDPRVYALATARRLEVLEPFKAFDCDAKIEPKVFAAPISLKLDNKLSLVLEDRPGYSKHALEGTATLIGTAGLTLKAGVEASGRCDAQAQLKLPIFGWFSALVMPAVRFGLGVELEAKVRLVQSELGVEGKIGFSPVLGWECGGATPACRGLDTVTTVNEFKTKMKFPSEPGMQAEGSVHFYVVAGLDAAILFGALNAGLVEARVGPKQSFDLAFVPDQAARTDYASSYDLKIEGVVEPGAALQEAIEKVIGDDSTTVKFIAEVATELWQSPKGSHTVSTSKARVNEAVDFKVSFAPPASVAYAVIGYNVTGVALYRRAEGEVSFTHWKAMELIGSHEATYRWVPGPADAGKYEFAAFVNTEILASLLEVEIDKDTIRSVEVSCFAASAQSSNDATRRRALATNIKRPNAMPLASTCADTWVGTTATGNGAYGPNQTEATLTLKRAPWIDTGSPTIVAYYAEGTVKVKHNDTNGCTTTPTEFAFGSETGREGGKPLESNQWFVDYSTSPPTVSGGGGVSATLTTVCPSFTHVWTTAFSFGHVPFGTPLSADGLGFSGSNQPFYWFDFKRP